MNLQLTRRERLLAASAITGVWALAGAAQAQETPVQTAPQAAPAQAALGQAAVDPREAKIEALEAEIQQLAKEVEDLKSTQSSGIRAIRTDVAAQPQVGITNARPQITAADGSFKFALRSVVQFDAAHYDVSPLRTDNDLVSGTNFRRARLGFDATAFRSWNFSLWGEFGGSGTESAGLNQAYVEYAGIKPFSWADPLRLRVGAWATPASLEDATPNTEMLFLERPAVAEMMRGVDAGDGREGAGAFINGKRWYLSGVFTGKVAGSNSPVYDQQEGYLVRAAFNPLHGATYDVHLGGSIQGVITPADTAAGALTTHVISLSQQPELRVDSNSTKLVSTGAITADGLTSYSVEGGGSFRNLYLAGEWFKIDVDRTAVGTAASPFNPSFSGWYLQGAWTLTGERHVWSSANGGFRGIYEPLHPFSLRGGTWGALEIAARYSVLELNDRAGVAGAATPVGGIRGGKQSITTVGLNWYPNAIIRFLLDYQWTNVDRLSATGADVGESVRAVSFRSQFAF